MECDWDTAVRKAKDCEDSDTRIRPPAQLFATSISTRSSGDTFDTAVEAPYSPDPRSTTESSAPAIHPSDQPPQSTPELSDDSCNYARDSGSKIPPLPAMERERNDVVDVSAHIHTGGNAHNFPLHISRDAPGTITAEINEVVEAEIDEYEEDGAGSFLMPSIDFSDMSLTISL